MNILIINHYAGSVKHGMEYRPYYMAKELINLGHNVSIIASSYSHLRDEIIGINTEKFDGITYYWEKNIKYNGNGVKRIFNMLFFSIKILIKSKYYSQLLKPDLVIASSPHPFIIFGAKRISNLSGSKLFFEVRDLWPLTIIKLAGLSKYNPLIFIMQIAEDYAYRKSDKIISLLPNASNYMFERGLDKDKFVYIPNGIDISEWEAEYELETNIYNVISDIKNKKKFIIGYVGAHGLSNALDTLIDAVKNINNDIFLVLVGDGPEKQKLKNKVDALNLDNVLFLEPINKKQIPKLLSMFDALYIGSDNNSLYQYGVSPNKLMDYMMSAKPIIQSMKASNDIVEESSCGISVEPENVEQIRQAILKIKSLSSNERDFMGKKGKEYVINNHSYSKLVNKLLGVIGLD